MNDKSFERIGDVALGGSVAEAFDSEHPNLLDRWDRHHEWWQERSASSTDSYCRTVLGRIGPESGTRTRDGRIFKGVNFASQDYLSLSGHPAIMAAAKDAIDRFGVHSAGSATLMGNTALSHELEARLADFLGYDDCIVFPTGWAAGYGLIKTLVRDTDFIVIDRLAHASLMEGARNATRNVFSFRHLSNEAVASRLERIRRNHPAAAILVVTETAFSMDSDVPDLKPLIDICRHWGATLMVDAAHDLGAIGPGGLGFIEQQGLTGEIDILMGSFSKTFASNGGFVACNHRALRMALRFGCGPATFSNAMSPVQAAVVLKAIEIVRSREGEQRRERLMDNSCRLRDGLAAAGFKVLGEPSAIVPTILGSAALSRLTTRYALESGAIVNLVEYPAVSLNTCRWRLQVMADHTEHQIGRLVDIAAGARARASEHVAFLASDTPSASVADVPVAMAK
jgi:glycine C-acetyltransferase